MSQRAYMGGEVKVCTIGGQDNFLTDDLPFWPMLVLVSMFE